MLKKTTIKDVDAYIKQNGYVKRLTNISFSFRYLTTNKSYGLDSLLVGNSKVMQAETQSYLLSRMSELSKSNMEAEKRKGKINGCEAIPVQTLTGLKESILNMSEIIDQNSVLTVFRFNRNRMRLICKTDSDNSNLLYVLAFDTDYSTYNH